MRIWGSYRFLDIFWNILDNRNGHLGQKYVKRGLLSFQGKIRAIATNFHGKITVFPVQVLHFHLSSLKSGVPTNTKIIFFEISNNILLH